MSTSSITSSDSLSLWISNHQSLPPDQFVDTYVTERAPQNKEWTELVDFLSADSYAKPHYLNDVVKQIVIKNPGLCPELRDRINGILSRVLPGGAGASACSQPSTVTIQKQLLIQLWNLCFTTETLEQFIRRISYGAAAETDSPLGGLLTLQLETDTSSVFGRLADSNDDAFRIMSGTARCIAAIMAVDSTVHSDEHSPTGKTKDHFVEFCRDFLTGDTTARILSRLNTMRTQVHRLQRPKVDRVVRLLNFFKLVAEKNLLSEFRKDYCTFLASPSGGAAAARTSTREQFRLVEDASKTFELFQERWISYHKKFNSDPDVFPNLTKLLKLRSELVAGIKNATPKMEPALLYAVYRTASELNKELESVTRPLYSTHNSKKPAPWACKDNSVADWLYLYQYLQMPLTIVRARTLSCLEISVRQNYPGWSPAIENTIPEAARLRNHLKTALSARIQAVDYLYQCSNMPLVKKHMSSTGHALPTVSDLKRLTTPGELHTTKVQRLSYELSLVVNAAPGDDALSHLRTLIELAKLIPLLRETILVDAYKWTMSLLEVVELTDTLTEPFTSEGGASSANGTNDGHFTDSTHEHIASAREQIASFIEIIVWLKTYLSETEQTLEERIFSKIRASKPNKPHIKGKKGGKRNKASKRSKLPQRKQVIATPARADDDDLDIAATATIDRRESSDEAVEDDLAAASAAASSPVDDCETGDEQAAITSLAVDTDDKQETEKQSILNNMRAVAAALLSQTDDSELVEAAVLNGSLRLRTSRELHYLRKAKIGQIVKELEREGWQHHRSTGDHQIYTNEIFNRSMSIPYAKGKTNQTLAKGTFNSIAKSAGWMQR